MFIVSPRIGLCNQLQSIVKTVLLAKKYNRDVYIDNFQIDLDSNRLCNINEILDIDNINNFYKEKNINVNIIKEIDQSIINEIENYKLKEINYEKISTLSNINSIIENNLDQKIIYLGNPVSLCINTSFNFDYNDYNNLYFFLITHLFFKKKFYDIKNYIKTQLNLDYYSTFHLRIEDDALSHFSMCYNLNIDEYNKILIEYYLNKINNENKKIYICSGILNYSNKINLDFYTNLLNSNNKICDKKNIDIDEYIKNNRELIAIIDLLIAYDSNNFIGCWISSFSQIINAYCNIKNKQSELFKI